MWESFLDLEKCIKRVWTIICFSATITTGVWQFLYYTHGKDVTAVAYKVYNEKEIVVYPSIGLCFSNVLIEEKLKRYQIQDIDPD